MILDVRQKEEIWSFLLRREKTKMKLVLCSNNASIRKSIRKKISSLLSKLQNHGVEIDDSIYDEGEFDGFSFPEEGVAYPSVNTFS